MIFVFKHTLPLITTFLSGVCFLLVGFLFGFSSVSDSFFLIVAIQGALGTIFQIFWHSVMPVLYTRRSLIFRSAIVSTTVVNILIFGVVYVFVSMVAEKYFSSYFNLSASGYFVFFQVHVFFKQMYLTEGRLVRFYLLDGVGYFLSIFGIIVLSMLDIKFQILSNIFNMLFFAWAGTCAIDFYFHRNIIKPIYSKRLTLTSLRKGVAPRLAGLLYSSKDFIAPILLNQYLPSGAVTIYAYANRILLSLYQVISIHMVNTWVSTCDNLDSICTMASVRRIANRALVIFSGAAVLAILGVMAIFFLIRRNDIDVLLTPQSWLIFVVAFMLFAIQTFEQPYARISYLRQSFNTQIVADLSNFSFFFLAAGSAFLTNSATPVLLGIALSQMLSFCIYRYSVARLFES